MTSPAEPGLSSRERARQLYAEHPDWSLEEIAAQVGVTRERVRQLLEGVRDPKRARLALRQRRRADVDQRIRAYRADHPDLSFQAIAVALRHDYKTVRRSGAPGARRSQPMMDAVRAVLKTRDLISARALATERFGATTTAAQRLRAHIALSRLEEKGCLVRRDGCRRPVVWEKGPAWETFASR